MMDIETVLMNEIHKFAISTARHPTAIYLGDVEFKSYVKMIIDRQGQGWAKPKGGYIPEFGGCKVYKVLENNHIKIA